MIKLLLVLVMLLTFVGCKPTEPPTPPKGENVMQVHVDKASNGTCVVTLTPLGNTNKNG
jgi:hypothetical protein